MKVSAQYAQQHLSELLDTADGGEEVEIARDGKPSAQIVIMRSRTMARPPIFGAGRGEIMLPSEAEWKALDLEFEDLMLDSPLMPDASQ
jgi:antitoxin (DNA-binding transcriptional repressor) of toxin-antitoxin stability system